MGTVQTAPSSKPSSEPATEPMAESTNFTTEPATEPMAESTNPTTEPATDLTVESTNPTTEPTEPTEPDNPVTKTVNPVTNSAKPVAETNPVVEPTDSTIRPTSIFDPKSISITTRSTMLEGTQVDFPIESFGADLEYPYTHTLKVPIHYDSDVQFNVGPVKTYKCTVQFISSRDDLIKYVELNCFMYQLYKTYPDFVKKYDDSFFEEKVLLAVIYPRCHDYTITESYFNGITESQGELSLNFNAVVQDSGIVPTVMPEYKANLIEITYDKLSNLKTISVYTHGEKKD